MRKSTEYDKRQYEDAPKEIDLALDAAFAAEVVPNDDFLPSPEELVKAQRRRTVTIRIQDSTIDFFKTAAIKNKTHYQTMINQLLDRYAEHYSK
ncbi:MAG: BrnA antitoxin family protein [Coriobacteriales bacterium]|jgi:uncharacterized protein (DUF4415 family)|nr:BrnA antitoxin family protein [Coriobacteriales bacterium]